ncbi:hypothetical protein GCM10007216_06640 [Thalassobacillus devorans]|uniref:RNase H type-1 domain-containing protein n=1 Tax=Thalassobacillus devorans TaxID=279813 RepID=A0ABQ1NJL4_9BACI|nr:ribonuclease H family protein [Thalassobacillus devorans]NIK27574.1 ribonuclease HI [Thalassobacillus devorans]GGC78826.1 hypothetical protein GCM10007216_06640 [Thalassobacillus devorans]
MKVRIEFTYKTPKGTTSSFTSEEMPAGQAILIAEDLEKTGRARSFTFIDPKDHTWSLKELKAFMKGIETEPHNITVYFDGGFDLKTKKSGLGCAIYYEQDGKSYRLRKNALVEELQTNNEAEYAALHLALQELDFLGVHHIDVKIVGDSQVVINQLNGEWPCLEDELSKWADRIEDKFKQLGITPEYQVISRKRNREADRLATQALEEIEITSTIEL